MTLLEAVNLCLRSIGETGVTSIDSNHPKVATILDTIRAVSKREQGAGRWFNTAKRVLPAIEGGLNDGKIDVSAYDYVRPWQRGTDGNLFPRGDFLYDPTADTEVIGHSVEAVVRWLYDDTDAGWAQMPRKFTDYIAYASALDFASNYDADTLQVQKLIKQTDRAYLLQNADHIRYSKLNLFWNGTTGAAIQNAYGDRYAVTGGRR